MATDGPTPPSCDPKIFKNGREVCVLDGRSNAIECWVKKVAKKADAKVDWHYFAGRARVLHLGNAVSRQRVLDAINELKDELVGTILSVEVGSAVVSKIDGQLVLDDPVAVAMVSAVSKQNCKNTLEINADRVVHFKKRITERGMTASKVVIVLLNVNDVHGGPLAEVVMPGYDWQKIRNRGETPFARGLVARDFIQDALEMFDKVAAEKLKKMTEVAVVVVDHGVAEVFVA